MDAAFEKDHTWEHAAKKSWTRPAQNLGDPNKDLILYFQLIPPFIKNDLLNHETAHKRQKELSSPEDFLRSLRIYYESNNEIKIQVPGKKANPCTYNILGFSSAKTDEWTTFLNILQGSNTYYIGRAGKKGTNTRKEYYRKRGLLKNINEKLIIFLRKEFLLQIPANFKLYERNPAKGSGTYKFIFQTEYDIGVNNIFGARYDKFSKDDLLNHLKEMHTTYTEKPEDWLENKIKDATQVLIGKHGITQDEIQNILFTKDEIQNYFSQHIYDKYENEEDSESDY